MCSARWWPMSQSPACTLEALYESQVCGRGSLLRMEGSTVRCAAGGARVIWGGAAELARCLLAAGPGTVPPGDPVGGGDALQVLMLHIMRCSSLQESFVLRTTVLTL
jgi:hypothetical protein